MARHTSLFQTPRSPLIQGRTRWERPLWEAWLGGLVVAVALSVLVFVMATKLGLVGGAAGILPVAVAVALAGATVGSALGSLAGRWFGWRWRWLGAALLGLGGIALALVVMQALHLPLFYSIGTR